MQRYKIEVEVVLHDDQVIDEVVEIGAPNEEAMKQAIGQLVTNIGVTGLTKFNDQTNTFEVIPGNRIHSIKAKIPSIISADASDMPKNRGVILPG